ncbi:uncharacterized protein CEXT_101311 [Caerostris extrusa]|uniref:Uncharacterized protein n=1 Tax=Caerostris extrusa TaxID=172846 RepID=A0AAV4SPX2_CAEEX|nr:uncharacterized protein CEXT_101311 [Caerostris extrusa]
MWKVKEIISRTAVAKSKHKPKLEGNSILEIVCSISNIDDGTYRCPDGSSPTIRHKRISGVLGAASSVTSIQVANLLRLFKIPQDILDCRLHLQNLTSLEKNITPTVGSCPLWSSSEVLSVDVEEAFKSMSGGVVLTMDRSHLLVIVMPETAAAQIARLQAH